MFPVRAPFYLRRELTVTFLFRLQIYVTQNYWDQGVSCPAVRRLCSQVHKESDSRVAHSDWTQAQLLEYEQHAYSGFPLRKLRRYDQRVR